MMAEAPPAPPGRGGLFGGPPPKKAMASSKGGADYFLDDLGDAVQQQRQEIVNKAEF